MNKELILGLIKTMEYSTKELKESINNDNITKAKNMMYAIKVTTKEIDDILRDFL